MILKRLFLFLGFILAVGWVSLATSAYGPGVNGDSVRYLSSGQNLLNGLGLIDYAHEPLLAWPPLYPIMLAILSSIFGDIYLVGWLLNIFLYGLNLILFVRLTQKFLPAFKPAPYLAFLMLAFSPSILKLHTNLSSDALFLCLILAFLLILFRLDERHKTIDILVLAVLAASASLIKYPGLVLAFIGLVMIFIHYKKTNTIFKASLKGFIFFLASGLPLISWVFFHNFLIHQSWFGERGTSAGLENLYILIEKALYWFLPISLQSLGGAYGLLTLILLAAALLIQPSFWKDYFKSLIIGPKKAIVLFFVLYSIMMLGLVSYSEHKDFQVDRLHIQLYLPLVLFLLTFLENAQPRIKINFPVSRNLLVSLIVFLWLSYPALNSIKYVQASLINGETSNNLYNTRAMNQADVVLYLKENPLPQGATLYSNHEGAAWFFTRHNTLPLPQGPVNLDDKYDLNEVLANYQNWPPQSGYLLWFDLPFKLHVVKPTELKSLITLDLLFKGEQGQLYFINPK